MHSCKKCKNHSNYNVWKHSGHKTIVIITFGSILGTKPKEFKRFMLCMVQNHYNYCGFCIFDRIALILFLFGAKLLRRSKPQARWLTSLKGNAFKGYLTINGFPLGFLRLVCTLSFLERKPLQKQF